MNKTFFTLIAAVLLCTACGNNATTKNEGIDSAQADVEESELAWASTAFPEMYTSLKEQDASFDPALFQETEGGTTTPFEPRFFPPEELEPFKPYLVYNEDSTKAIDLVSYNYIIRKKIGQAVLEPSGPDTEVAIINMKNNMRTRIFFSGPGTVVKEGRWLDDDNVLLGGAETLTNTAIKPILLRIDVKDNRIERFTYTDSIQARLQQATTINR